MKVIVAILCLLTAFENMSAQRLGQIDSALLPVSRQHYQSEYTFDKPVHPDDWMRVGPGLHAAFASTDEPYFSTEVPQLSEEAHEWKTIAWKGDRVNCQLVLWSTDTITQLRVSVGDLRSADAGIAAS